MGRYLEVPGADYSSIAIGKVTPITNKTAINVIANPSEGGNVSGGGYYDAGANVTLSATANSGYHFVKWNDNSTSATKSIVVGSTSVTYTAYFSDYTELINRVDASSADDEYYQSERSSQRRIWIQANIESGKTYKIELDVDYTDLQGFGDNTDGVFVRGVANTTTRTGDDFVTSYKTLDENNKLHIVKEVVAKQNNSYLYVGLQWNPAVRNAAPVYSLKFSVKD